jgi:hypothetical protein
MALAIEDYAVAPHVGAWIETYHISNCSVLTQVAPHVGAWIETEHFGVKSIAIYVAPHVGAWIETCLRKPVASP